jgi:hypothetical protein
MNRVERWYGRVPFMQYYNSQFLNYYRRFIRNDFFTHQISSFITIPSTAGNRENKSATLAYNE